MKYYLILILFAFASSLCFAQKQYHEKYKDGIIIFKVKPEYKDTFKIDSRFLKLKEEFGLDSLEQMFPYANVSKEKYNAYGREKVDISTIYKLKTNLNIDVEKISDAFARNDMVEYAEPLYEVELLFLPDDPMNVTDQYWLSNIKALEAWDIHQGDTNIVIGISDTGTDLSHDDLIYNIKNNYADLPDGVDNDLDGFVDNFRGWDFAENNNNTQVDVNDHGVWVSGIAGASTNNGIGVSGAGFKCKTLPLKICNSDNYLVNSYQSIVYAANHGVDVINCSWGGEFYQQMAQDVIDYAVINHDMLVVAAAGNTDSKCNYYPASYNNVLSVAGTTELDERWSPENTPTSQGSSYSYHVDVSAPAAMFSSTTTGSDYTLMWGGTSFAAPIVSGCAGILRAAYPDYNANQIAELIKISADLIDTIPYNVPYAGMLGTGRINLYNALTMDNTPAIVIQEYDVEQSDEYIVVNAEFINYLKEVEGLTITVSTDSEYADVQTSQIFSGSLGSLESYISENEIVVEFLEDTPKDYLLTLNFAYDATDYNASQTIEININPGHKNITTQKLELSVTSSGRLGFSDVNSSVGDGFVFEEYFPVFYDCGIISGTSASEIYSGVRQVSDFSTITYPLVVQDLQVSDQQIDLCFDDSDDIVSRDIEIHQSVFAWDDEENQNFFIIDYWIINNGLFEIEDFYFGLFADWDLIDAASNSIDVIEDENVMYCYKSGAQSLYAGFKILSDQQNNNYGLAQTEDGDGVVDITDGFADIEKYYMISNNVIPDSSIIDDMVQYSGVGPVNILAGDSIKVGIAIIASDNLYEFEQAVIQSQVVYDEVLHPNNIQNSNIQKLVIYPNPADEIIKVKIPINILGNCTIRIIDLLGKVIYSEVVNSEDIELNIKYLESGVYKLEVLGKEGCSYNDSFIISH